MNIHLYTLKETLFDGEAKEIIAKTPMGEISILDGHIPLITSITGPDIKIIDKENRISTIVISSGVLEVKEKSEIVVLASR